MFVGVTRIVLSIPGARSLKDRRRVVHAFRDRVRARFSASITEVGDLERFQAAVLGVAVVARDAAHCEELTSLVRHEAQNLRDALVTDVATEVVSYGEGGSGIRGGIEASLAAGGLTGDDDE
jgi:uncharacterized protein YlxP (DUF503 family)